MEDVRSNEEVRNVHSCCMNSHIIEELNAQRKNNQFSDVILICGPEKISAHRSVLAAASPYFATMFSGNFSDSTQKEIVMHSLDADSLKHIVEFIYGTPFSPLCDMYGLSVLETSLFLQIDWITKHYLDHLLTTITTENCLEYWLFAKLHYQLKLLEEAAYKLVEKHFIEMSHLELFCSLKFEDLQHLLSLDKINKTYTADALLGAIGRWYMHKPEVRVEQMKKLRMLIELGDLSEDACNWWESLDRINAGSPWMSRRKLLRDSRRKWFIFILDKMGRKPDLDRIDLNMQNLVPLKPSPNYLFAHSCVGFKGLLWVQGGSSNNQRLSHNYVYNIHADTWFNISTPLLMPRSHHRSVVLNDKIYVLGGNLGRDDTKNVESLHCETRTVMFEPHMLTPRCSMGAAVLDKCLYVMGGELNRRAVNTVERLDTRTDTWEQLPSMSVVQGYASSASLGDNIYCCQGVGTRMERFNIRANKWESVGTMEREFFEIFTADGELYSVSGKGISRFDLGDNKWKTVYKFDSLRGWDTAISLEMCNYA